MPSRKNTILAAGLALPVLLVAIFFVVAALPKYAAVPPQYEMLFTAPRRDFQNPRPYIVDFFVKDGMLKGRVSKGALLAGGQNFNWRGLMAYDGKTQGIREVPYDLSKIGDVADGTELVFDEFKNMKVDGSAKSPDGYELISPRYPPKQLLGGLVTVYEKDFRVAKGSASFVIPSYGIPGLYIFDIQLVGWVLQK